MMTLYEKIKTLYPELQVLEFRLEFGTITLVKEGDIEYIAKWEHPTLARPTEEQLA